MGAQHRGIAEAPPVGREGEGTWEEKDKVKQRKTERHIYEQGKQQNNYQKLLRTARLACAGRASARPWAVN